VLEKVPTKPVEIDLPSLSSTDIQKESHKDFYKVEEIKEEKSEEDPEERLSLVQQKLTVLKPNMNKVEVQKKNTLKLSDQPFSKFQAIFNLEQIKERNKPKLAKEDLPKAPFFLFDIEKATTLDGPESDVKDFLADNFFASF
jgi:hypothetical protein